MGLDRFMILINFLVLALLHGSFAQNITYNIPLDPSLVGQREFGKGACTPDGALFSSEVRIESWGIFFSPLFHKPYFGGPACEAHIVSLFRRQDKASLILYRPSVSTSFFSKVAPEAFNALKTNIQSPIPCALVAVQRVQAWGPTRNTFISLVRDAVSGLERIREFDCVDLRSSPQTALKRSFITTSAITYYRKLAYDNFFRV